MGGRWHDLRPTRCPETLPRWRAWYRHVLRDQVAVWVPACMLGVALPSMLSVEFLPRCTTANQWIAAGMTADGLRAQATASWGPGWGWFLWHMTLFCGFLVLGMGTTVSADGVIRRWVDVFWTASPRLRAWDPRQIKWLYFGVVAVYAAAGVALLSLGRPLGLLTVAANIMNFGLGFSCFHTLVVNTTLLPPALRPGRLARAGLVLAGLYFTALALVSAVVTFRVRR